MKNKLVGSVSYHGLAATGEKRTARQVLEMA